MKALRCWALASVAVSLVSLSGCPLVSDKDPELLKEPLALQTVLQGPVGLQTLDLSNAVSGQPLLTVHVRVNLIDPDSDIGCPGTPEQEASERFGLVIAGDTSNPLRVPGRHLDQRVPMRGLTLQPLAAGVTCEALPRAAAYTSSYQLSVSDAALLAQQPIGDFELEMAPQYCEPAQPQDPAPAPGSEGCRGERVSVRLRITAVPAAAPGTTLRVEVQGPGRLISTPSGIECGADCMQDFPPGTEVTLSALPDIFARFVGFSGDTGCVTGRISLGTTALRCVAEFADGGAVQAWQAVGDALNVDLVPSQATGAAVVLTAGNQPWVAWGENGLLQVKRWDGNDWQLMGELSVLQSVVDAPVMALDADGRPWVAWQEDAAGSGQAEVYVKRWDGANWQVAVLPATNSFSRSMPHLALHQGRMLLAWVDRSPFGQNVRLYGWDGSAWQRVAGSALGDEELMVPRIASDGSELKVAFVAANARVQLTRLLPVLQFLQAESSFDEVVSSLPAMSLVHSPRDGWLLALQPSGAQGRNFQVRRWAGGAWDMLGGVHGRSEPGGLVTGLAMVNGAADQPLLAWGERYGGVNRILVQRWENGAWVDQGSAVGLVGRFGPGIEGPVALADGLRPTLAYSVRSAGTVGGQFATDDAIRAVELR